MNLFFDKTLSKNYRNPSQIARVLTENWVKHNAYCPNCGNSYLHKFSNNQPVADFYCDTCLEEFELKSRKQCSVGNKVVGGAYSTMIERIKSNNNPNFFFLTYDKNRLLVNNFLIIPKHFFTQNMIEKRKALSSKAKRAGWVGCNIDLTSIPESGKVFLVKNTKVIEPEKVLFKWNENLFLRNEKEEARSWIVDIMNCLDKIHNKEFSLSDVYVFETELAQKHPNNHFIKDKIRQQLQLLRDKGLIIFKQRGLYQKNTL